MGVIFNQLIVIHFYMIVVSLSLVRITVSQECGTIEVLRNYTGFENLRGCRVIKGYLIIAHMSQDFDESQYANVTFPELREITEFFILYSVPGLRTLRVLFPNLTVIRGRRLFLDYALGVFSMPDLKTIDLKSLIAIQKGSVFVVNCPELCFLNQINWERLTLSPGQNHIVSLATNETCPYRECHGCNSYCWSNFNCQKFQNANLVNLIKDTRKCNSNCLGGCHNSTSSGCVVCNGLTNRNQNQNECVKECPKDKYLHNDHQRCYTRSECIQFDGLIFKNQCLPSCLSGYSVDKTNNSQECLPCQDHCPKICEGDSDNQLIIENLANAEAIKGCEVVNASLIIRLRNFVDTMVLERSLRDILEIRGYLKIFRSPYLKSLSFLSNLEKISGSQLHDNTYAMVIYDNKNLEELWSSQRMKSMRLTNGAIFIHLNNRLCNQQINAISNNIQHDNRWDSIQINDQEVLCDPIKLDVSFKVLSQDKTNLYWPKEFILAFVEILYLQVAENSTISETSELDDNVCQRILWTRILINREDLTFNDTHYLHNLTNLEQNTRYAYLVKSFENSQQHSVQSNIRYFKTLKDIPLMPHILTINKTSSTLTLGMVKKINNSEQDFTHYNLDIFTQPDDKVTTDLRNYCSHPLFSTGFHQTTDDYDECCSRQENLMDDQRFATNVEDMYRCSVTTLNNCDINIKSDQNSGEYLTSLRVPSNQTNIFIENLKHFTLYNIHISACDESRCGSYFFYSERTSALPDNDLVKDLWACMYSDTQTFHVRFSEPPNPNGVVVAYVVHFRQSVFRNGSEVFYPGTNCITRLQHEKSNFEFIAQLKVPFEDVAIRTNSLAEKSQLGNWIAIQECEKGGLSSFLILLILLFCSAFIAGLWYTYKRRLWMKWVPLLLVAFQFNIDRSDEEILMEDFEIVRFQNLQDDEYSD